jgi:Fe-S oxidoreductase
MAFDYGRFFGEIALSHDLTTRRDERTWRLAAPPREGERHAVVLYLGCNVLRTSHMIQTVTAIFDRLGLDYVAVGGPTYCCGIVHHTNGDTAASEGMSRRTIELFERMQPEEVVMWCPSCIYFYDEVRHAKLPFRVSHTAEFLARRLPDFTFSRRVEASVALHYHTVSEPRRREGEAGRRLLAAVPGLRVVDFEPDPRYGRTCSPAIRAEVGLATWNQMVRDDIDRARAAGASIMAGIYHGCHRLMCGFEVERPIVFEHYLSVFARGLDIEFEDTYKKHRLWADPERVLADVAPCQQANGLDPGRVRELVERTFGAAGGSSPMDTAPPS